MFVKLGFQFYRLFSLALLGFSPLPLLTRVVYSIVGTYVEIYFRTLHAEKKISTLYLIPYTKSEVLIVKRNTFKL